MESWEIPAAYEYKAICEAPGCNRQLGVVRFVHPHLGWDPKSAGVMCKECHDHLMAAGVVL